MDFSDLRVWLKVLIPAIALMFWVMARTPMPNPTQDDVKRIVSADKTGRYPAGNVSKAQCRQSSKGYAQCYFYIENNKGDILDEFSISLTYQNKKWELNKKNSI